MAPLILKYNSKKNGNLYADCYAIVIVLLLLSACGVRQPITISEGVGTLADNTKNPTSPNGTLSFLTGNLPLTTGTSIQLDSLRDKPVVLTFASDTCDICLEESLDFKNSLKNQLNSPTKIYLLTALVGATPSDASDWKKANKLPWGVGWDEDLILYKKYCGGASVPCTIVQTPDRGIVMTHIGKAEVNEIVKLTGSWEVQ